MNLEILLIIGFAGAFITYFLGKISRTTRDVFTIIISLALVTIIASLYSFSFERIFYLGFMDIPLILRINSLSWFFAIAISVIGCLSIVFSLSYMKKKERTDFFFFMIVLVNSAMIGVVLSGDLLSFYIFWEIMSWSTFLLISYNRGDAIAAAKKYIIMSIFGSVIMLFGILSVYSTCGSLTISEISNLIIYVSPGYTIMLLIIFGIAFGIKNALIPLHIWLPVTYTESPSTFTIVISGMLTRLGVFGFLLIMYVILGAASVLHLGYGVFRFNYVLAWLGAVSIVIPTFIALLQNDAKKLLAWSSIGQGGYMILGIAYGTSLGVVGGIFHTLNHAIYIVLLFMVVGAVEYRTGGERDLNSLGGLIKKMPVAFLGALLGICGLIGVPLTNGFVSKWLIYKTLILEGSPFLAFAALIGTWGAVLYVYKFIHGIFLGQLPEKYKNVQGSPFSMRLPIIILSFAILVFGILPGIPLKVINSITSSFGLKPLDISVWGITSESGMLNIINIFAAILVVSVILWLISKASRKAIVVTQDDNYAAGAPVPIDKYHYTVNFYNPLQRMIAPYLRDSMDDLYRWFSHRLRNLSNGMRQIYTGYVGNYVMYIILFLALLIFIQIKWLPW